MTTTNYQSSQECHQLYYKTTKIVLACPFRLLLNKRSRSILNRNSTILTSSFGFKHPPPPSIGKKIPLTTSFNTRALTNVKIIQEDVSSSPPYPLSTKIVNTATSESNSELDQLIAEIEQTKLLHTIACPSCLRTYSQSNRKLTEECGHSICFVCLLKKNSDADASTHGCMTCQKLVELNQKRVNNEKNSVKPNQTVVSKSNVKFEFKKQSNVIESDQEIDPLIVNESFGDDETENDENSAIAFSSFNNKINSNTASKSASFTFKINSSLSSANASSVFDLGEKISRTFNANLNLASSKKIAKDCSFSNHQDNESPLNNNNNNNDNKNNNSYKNSFSTTKTESPSFKSSVNQNQNSFRNSNNTSISNKFNNTSDLIDLSKNTSDVESEVVDEASQNEEDEDNDSIEFLKEADSNQNEIHVIEDDDDGNIGPKNVALTAGQKKLLVVPNKSKKSNSSVDEIFLAINDDDDEKIEDKDVYDCQESVLKYKKVVGIDIPDIETYPKMDWLFNDISDCSQFFRNYEKYAHTTDMMTTFKIAFGLNKFRPQQSEAINAAMLGKF